MKMLIKKVAVCKNLRFKKISIPPGYGIIISPCEACKREYFVPSYNYNGVYAYSCSVNDVCSKINRTKGRIKTNYRYCDPEKKGDR